MICCYIEAYQTTNSDFSISNLKEAPVTLMPARLLSSTKWKDAEGLHLMLSLHVPRTNAAPLRERDTAMDLISDMGCCEWLRH